MGVDRGDEGGDVLLLFCAEGFGVDGGAALGREHAGDEFHAFVPAEATHFDEMGAVAEGGVRRQGLARGEDEPGARGEFAEAGAGLQNGGEHAGIRCPRAGRGGIRRRGQDGLHVIQHEHDGAGAEGRREDVESVLRGIGAGGEVRHELRAPLREHGADGLGREIFHRGEGGIIRATSGDEPAAEFRGQRGLALAAFAAQKDVVFPRLQQEALGGEQQTAATDETVWRRRGQVAGGEGAIFFELVSDAFRVGRHGQEHGVRTVLIEHGHEPVLQLQRRALDLAGFVAAGFPAPAALAVGVQGALTGEHGRAHARAFGEGGIKRPREAPRRLHQHAVAHGHHRRDTTLEQASGHGCLGVSLRLRGLAGLQKEQAHAAVAQFRAEAIGGDDFGAAVVQLGAVVRVLEDERAEAVHLVEDAVAVEVDDVKGAARGEGGAQLFAQRGEGRRRKDFILREVAERIERLGERLDGNPVVDVGDAVRLGPGADGQHAQRGMARRFGQLGGILAAGQRAAHAHADAVMEEIAVSVVKEFPGQGEEFRGGFQLGAVRGFLLLRGRTARNALGRGLHGEAAVALRCLGFPHLDGIWRVGRRGIGGRQRLPQIPAPLWQAGFDATGAFRELAVGREEVALKVEAELGRLDPAQRRDERELRRLRRGIDRIGRVIGKAGRGCRTAHFRALRIFHQLKPRRAQPQDEVRQRHCRTRLSRVRRPAAEALQSIKQRGQQGIESTRTLRHADADDFRRPVLKIVGGGRLGEFENLAQLSGGGFRQEQRDDAFPLLPGVAQLALHPMRAGGLRTAHGDDGRRPIEEGADVVRQVVAGHELGVLQHGVSAGFHPALERGDKGVVPRRMGDEDSFSTVGAH